VTSNVDQLLVATPVRNVKDITTLLKLPESVVDVVIVK
jgi:hypothetical protein